MRDPQKLRLPLQWVTAAYWALILTLTHIPPRHLPHINLWDKYEHLGAFGCLGGLLFLTLWAMRPNLAQIGICVIAIGMAYAAFDEITQPIFGRDCELMDWMADTTGLAIAAVCMTYLRYLGAKGTN